MFIAVFVNFLRIILTKARKSVAVVLNAMSKLGVIFQKLIAFRTSGNKYGVFGILIGLFLVMYALPAFFRWSRWFHSDHVASCIDEELYGYESAIKSWDAIYFHDPKRETDQLIPIPLSGNGYLLVSLVNGELYIRHHRTLSVPTHVGVLFQADVQSNYVTKSEGVFLTHVADGYVQHMKCYIGLDHPASISSKVYAHRSIPNLIVQEITLKNPSSNAVKVAIRRQSASLGNSDTMESVLSSYVTASSGHDKSKLFFSHKVHVDVPESKNITHLHIYQSGLPSMDEVLVQAHKTETFVIYTLANYTNFDDAPQNLSPSQEKDLSSQNQRSLTDMMTKIQDSKALFRNHLDVTRKIFNTGFGISHSKAPNAINGDRVNLTLYYVSAHYLTMALMKPSAKESAEKVIFDADKCYDDHHTLQHARLWEMPLHVVDYFDFVRRWAITLEKHGCRDLVATGAEGVVTSMVLSFGGLHFTSHHLEFTIHPSELHRDLMHFRGIPYGPHVTLNISVQMGEDNRAQLFVSVDRVGTAYYACDAGCLDAPVKLGQTPVKIPVKLTNPVMPILYITSDKPHIEELKDALHFTDIQEAPAHEDDVIALHKHGHQFGGLPTVFWIVVILLIAIFHLFLIKLIVTEYYKSESKYSPPPAPYHRMQRFAA